VKGNEVEVIIVLGSSALAISLCREGAHSYFRGFGTLYETSLIWGVARDGALGESAARGRFQLRDETGVAKPTLTESIISE
jgi:hypothetical protein